MQSLFQKASRIGEVARPLSLAALLSAAACTTPGGNNGYSSGPRHDVPRATGCNDMDVNRFVANSNMQGQSYAQQGRIVVTPIGGRVGYSDVNAAGDHNTGFGIGNMRDGDPKIQRESILIDDTTPSDRDGYIVSVADVGQNDWGHSFGVDVTLANGAVVQRNFEIPRNTSGFFTFTLDESDFGGQEIDSVQINTDRSLTLAKVTTYDEQRDSCDRGSDRDRDPDPDPDPQPDPDPDPQPDPDPDPQPDPDPDPQPDPDPDPQPDPDPDPQPDPDPDPQPDPDPDPQPDPDPDPQPDPDPDPQPDGGFGGTGDANARDILEELGIVEPEQYAVYETEEGPQIFTFG